jgi:hypothetical protein
MINYHAAVCHCLMCVKYNSSGTMVLDLEIVGAPNPCIHN